MRRFRIVYAVSVSVVVLLLVAFGTIGWLTGLFTASDDQRNETPPSALSVSVAASTPEAEESVHTPDYDPTSTTAKTAQASDSPDFDVAAAPKVTQPLLAWAAAYFAASESEKSAMLPKGVELAQARRTVLFEMIKTAPEAAWEAALPRAVHAQLPDEIRTHLETFVHTVGSIRIEYSCAFTGDGEHVHAAGEMGDHLDEHQHYVTLDERDYRAYVYGSRLRNLFVQNTSIHGIAIDRHLAISESRARLLEPGESLPTSTAAPTPGAVAVEADGKVSILDSAEALTTFEASLIEAEEDPYLAELGDGAAGSSDVVGRVAASQTIGEKRALVMLVDFDDYPGRPVTPGGITMTEDFIVGVMSGMNGVSQFLRENSYGKTSVIVSPTVDGDSPDVTEVLRMPYTASVYANTRGRTQLYLDARAVASSNGYDVASYDRLICVPRNLSGFDGGTLFTGWAGVAASPGSYSVINGYFDIRTLNHELGHNYGVPHSSLWMVADGNPISLATNAVSQAYGDRYDTMGADAGHVTKHYNQWFKNYLWWIPDDTIIPAEETGIYRVFRLDHKDANLNLPRAIKIERDDVRNYWIGYRTVNYHTNINEKAYVLWGYKSRRDSHLLDMNTPGASIDDAGLEIGQALDDVDAGISFSPVAKGGSGADEWMNIQVTFVPRLVFASTSVTAGENIGYAAVKVNRMCNPAGAVSVSYATSPGTAVAPADYTTTSGTLTWDDGDASTKTIQVPLVDDGISESPETFTLSLSSPVGAMFWDGGASITTTVTVLDYYDGPPNISWATPVKQDIGLPYGVGLYIDVSIEDDGAGGGSVSCLWQTVSAPVGESVSWDSQNTTNTAVVFSGDGDYTLRILAMDGVNTTTQDLFVTVGATERYGINFGPVVEAGADLVDFVNTDVVLGGSVSDDGLPGASITTQWLQFDGPDTATFGDASAPTSTVSASTAGTYTLRLTADDGQIKTFDDTSYNALSTTGAGYFRFTTDQRSVAEDDSNLEVFVERLGGKQGAVSVGYAATDGSATNGIDYVLSSGTLSWANNQTGTRSFQVSILSDLQSESDETFTLQLTNATGGAGILSPSNMVVTIVEPPRVNNSTGATPLTVTSSRLRGEVEAGIGSVAWICWGLQDAGNNSTGLWEHVEAIGTVSVATPFAVDVTGLDTNATYYYRCFVTNISGTAWSSSPETFSGIPAYSGDQDIGAIVPVTTLNFDAHDPASGVDDNNWNSLNSTNTYDWDFGADVTLVSVTSGLTVLQKAYRFTGGSGDSGGATWDGLSSTSDASWEMWIKPDDSGSSDAGQVLFETGAAGIGTTMWYQPGVSNDNQGIVLWTIDAGNDTTQVSTVSAVIDTLDFTHVAFVYDRDFSGTTDLMQLYVNGNLVATNAMVGLDDWSGADGSGLGNKGASGVAISAGSGRYVGDMSVLRFWQSKAISASDVMNNYSAALKKRVVNNAPTGMYPTQAELNGSVNALGTNYDVYVYWGTTNGGTNTAGWTTNTYVTSVTDEVANVSHTALGLTEAQDYYYTFAASNATAMLWAEPSWRFTTLPTNKDTPVVSNWPSTSPITYGQAVSNATFSGGSASVSGDFSYNTPGFVPNAGTYAAAVTFTPDDITNYTTVAGSVDVSVAKATPTVSIWPSATSIEVGQAVSNSTLIGGTASIAGSYGFVDPTATPSLGTHPVDVIFSPTDSANYVSVTGTVQLAVTAAPTPVTVMLSDLSQPYDGSGKSVTVTTDPADRATIVTYEGSATLPVNAGSYAVEATVVDAGYTGSTNGTLQITKIDPVVNTWPTATVIVVGQALSSSTLGGESVSVPGAFGFDAPGTIPPVGVYTAAVTFLPADFSNYNTLAGEVEVTVLPLPPAVPTGLSAAGSPGQVDLSWNASVSATSYNVKRSMTQGSGYVTVGSPSSTSFSDPVANGATYYYVVSAVNAGGESPNSGEVSVTLLHVLPFSEDFEALDIGDLDGQRFWSATNALVQTNVAQDVKAASITSEEGYASQSFAGSETNVWTDLKVQVVFSESEPSGFGTDPATVLYFNTNGNPVAYNGTNAVVLSGTTVSSGAWVRVTIHSDYVQKKWNLHINDQEVATDLGFYSAARPYYSELRVQGAASTQYANIDDILIDTVSPLTPPEYYSFIVNSLYGVPTPSGTNLLAHGSTVNFAIAGTPEIIPTNTMYEAIGWTRTGSSPATGTTTNDSFVITNNTTLTWQWSTNYWVELNTAGE